MRFMVGLNDHKGIFHLTDSMIVHVGPTSGLLDLALSSWEPSALSREVATST